MKNDPHKVASAKYNFIVAIKAIIDICNHLISRNGYRVPEDYADTFRVLAENKILPAELTATLIKMAKFSNRLVHLYWKIDVDFLFTILQNNLEDFSPFWKQLNKILKTKYKFNS